MTGLPMSMSVYNIVLILERKTDLLSQEIPSFALQVGVKEQAHPTQSEYCKWKLCTIHWVKMFYEIF